MAKEKDTTERIKEIIADLMGMDESVITPSSNLKDDLMLDSLDSVEAIMLTEEAFSIEISDEEAEELVTVEDIVNLVTEKVSHVN